jgi:hypothetical protein
MGSVSRYREEADRCRNLAASSSDAAAARRWNRLADEYAVLAEELAAAKAGRVPILRVPRQRRRDNSNRTPEAVPRP